MANLTSLPSLDDVASDPARAHVLPANVLQGLLCRCVTLQTALLGALVATGSMPTDSMTEADSLIDVDAAAARLGMSKDWLYRQAKQLPFHVPQGRLLRFSSHGIDRYIRSRQSRVYV